MRSGGDADESEFGAVGADAMQEMPERAIGSRTTDGQNRRVASDTP